MKIRRRDFLYSSAGLLATGLVRGSASAGAAFQLAEDVPCGCAGRSGLCIVPGAWRPWFPWEQIAWVRTPWSDALFPDFIWLDFPEAIFSQEGLRFLSHINPDFPSKYPSLPACAWRTIPQGIAYTRSLPDGVTFGGRIVRTDERNLDFDLIIDNQSPSPLTNITLQTCCFLKPSGRFSQPTQDNKFVHTPQKGWLSLREAAVLEPKGRFAVGWRGGPRVSDSPWIVTRSRDGQHWVAMTWFDDTLSFIGNPVHPCFHADPKMGNLEPQQSQTIRGRLRFFIAPSLDEIPSLEGS